MDWTFLPRGLLIGFSIAAPVGPIGVLCIRRTLADGRAAGFVSGLGAATADAAYGAIAGFGLTAISGLLIGGQTWLRLVGGFFLVYLGIRTLFAHPAEHTAGATGGHVSNNPADRRAAGAVGGHVANQSAGRGPAGSHAGTPGAAVGEAPPGASASGRELAGASPSGRELAGASPSGRELAGAYVTTLVLTLTNPMTILSFAAVFAGLGIVAARGYGSAALLVAGVFGGSALWWFILSGVAAALRGRIGAGVLRRVNAAAGIIIVAFGALALLSLR